MLHAHAHFRLSLSKSNNEKKKGRKEKDQRLSTFFSPSFWEKTERKERKEKI
jgi:hypothetical protein